MRQSVGLPPVPALLVRSVEDGEPAGAAGVRTGDLLLRAGTRQLRSIGALYEAIAGAGENRRLRIVLLRGMEEHRVTVRLGDSRAAHDTVAATAGRTARGEHTV
jgi:S1-C subfamily serine protease